MQAIMQDDYNILLAGDGEQGLNLLKERYQ